MTSDQGPETASAGVVPGEFLFAAGGIEINPGADRIELDVLNTGDRPVQVGSHVHFPQANAALRFDRAAAHGRRLDIPAGTAVRFEPGLGQRITLIPLRGAREVPGIGIGGASPSVSTRAPADGGYRPTAPGRLDG